MFEAKYRTEKCDVFVSLEVEQDNFENSHVSLAEIDEVSIAFKMLKEKLGLEVGKKIIRWGTTDQISPVDIVNPEDLTHGLNWDYEKRKIPVWMIKVETVVDDYNIEGVFIPFFESAEIDYFDSNWATLGNLKNEFKKQGINIKIIEDELNKSVVDSEFAFRISKTIFKNWDSQFCYFNGRADLPLYKMPNILKGQVSDLVEHNIDITYLRTQMFGIASETILENIFGKDFGFRAEIAYNSNQPFLKENFNSYTSATVETVAGIDYLSTNNWYFNTQLATTTVLDYESGTLYNNHFNASLIGEISKELMDGDLKIGINYSLGLTEKSLYLSPWAEYNITDNLKTEVRVASYNGEDNTLMDFYEDNDQISVLFKYIF